MFKTKEEAKKYYESLRRTDGNEPTWVLSPFDTLYDEETANSDGFDWMKGFEVGKTYCFASAIWGGRIADDGFKVGTNSWAFMGRRDSQIIEYGNGLVGIYRKLSAKVRALASKHGFSNARGYYCLYSLTDAMLL